MFFFSLSCLWWHGCHVDVILLSFILWLKLFFFSFNCLSPKNNKFMKQRIKFEAFHVFKIFMQCVFVLNNTFVFANLSSLNYEQGQWYFYSWLLRNPTYLTWFHQFCTCQPNKVNDSIFYYWKVKSNFVACQGIIHIYPTSSYMQLFLLNKFCPFFNKKIGNFFFFLV